MSNNIFNYESSIKIMVSSQGQDGPCCPCAGSHKSNGTRSASHCKTRACKCRMAGRPCTNCGPGKLGNCTNCSAAEEEAKVETPSSQPLNNQSQRSNTQTQREDIADDDFVQQFFETAYDDVAARAASVGPPSKWKTMLVEAFGGKLFACCILCLMGM